MGCSPPGQKESDTTEQLSTAKAGDMGLVPELEKFPGIENGNPLQYSCLEKIPPGSMRSQRAGHNQAFMHGIQKSPFLMN